jgi:NitT/TauT family transport system substrate-binding protein
MMGVLVMEKAGLKKGDVQMVALGSLGGALTALEKGVIDVTAMPVILFRTRGGESKYRVLVGPKELPLIPSQLGMATTKAMKAPERARHPGSGPPTKYRSSQGLRPLPAKDVGIMVKEIADAKFWTEGRIEMPLLENTVRAMKFVGMLQKDVDLKKMVDSSFLPRDLQK